MSFGLRDKDWVDPPDEPVGKPEGYTCRDCGLVKVNPDGGKCYCPKLDTWVEPSDEDECDDFVL